MKLTMCSMVKNPFKIAPSYLQKKRPHEGPNNKSRIGINCDSGSFEIKGDLCKDGKLDVVNEITGTGNWKTINEQYRSYTFNSSGLTSSRSSSSYCYGLIYIPYIIIEGFSSVSIIVTAASIYGAFRIGIRNTVAINSTFSKYIDITGTGTFTLDISGYDSSYYFGIYTESSTFTISSIKLIK